MDLSGHNDAGIGRFEDLYERNFQQTNDFDRMQPFMQINNSAVVSSRGDENLLDYDPPKQNYKQQQPYNSDSIRQ